MQRRGMQTSKATNDNYDRIGLADQPCDIVWRPEIQLADFPAMD